MRPTAIAADAQGWSKCESLVALPTFDLPTDPTVGLVELVDLTDPSLTLQALGHVTRVEGSADLVMVRLIGWPEGGYRAGDNFAILTERVVIWPEAVAS